MGWLVALLALGLNLLVGILFVVVGAALAAFAICWLTARIHASRPDFRRTWKLSLLVFFVGMIVGNILQLSLGGPSPLSAIIGLPIHVVVYALVLKWKLGAPYAGPKGFQRGLLVGLAATVFSCAVILGTAGLLQRL